jgi:hypothetical protein
MNKHDAGAVHEAFYADVVKLIDKHAGKLSKPEMLAVAANLVGKLLALQDQRTMPPEVAVQLVAKNLELGNQQAIAAVKAAGGTRQ